MANGDPLAGIPNVDPGQSLLAGVRAGQGILQARLAREAAQREQALFNVQMEARRRALAAEQEKALEAQQRHQMYSQDLAKLFEAPTPMGFAQLSAKYPGHGKAIKQAFEMLEPEQKAKEFREIAGAFNAVRSGNPAIALQIVQTRIDAGDNSPVLANVKDLLATDDPVNHRRAQAVIGLLGSAADPGSWEKIAKEAESRVSESDRLVKIEADARKARVEARIAEATEKRNIQKANRIFRGGKKQPKVQSTNRLGGGALQLVMSDGTVRVMGPDGKLVVGDEAARVAQDAADFEADKRRKIELARAEGRLIGVAELGARAEGAKAAGKQAIKIAGELTKKIGAVRRGIGNLDDAIDAIDAGASTGAIEKMLPSIRRGSVLLDNARRRLGLDVVGSVTFGALSESELNLALDTAIPLGLAPDDLRKWLEDKKTAQQKLLPYLKEQARFLSRPGNTLSSWLDRVDAGEISSRSPFRDERPAASVSERLSNVLRSIKGQSGE